MVSTVPQTEVILGNFSPEESRVDLRHRLPAAEALPARCFAKLSMTLWVESQTSSQDVRNTLLVPHHLHEDILKFLHVHFHLHAGGMKLRRRRQVRKPFLAIRRIGAAVG